MSNNDWQLKKRSTGIPGLDRLVHGGLPANQATLIPGDTGTGKPVLTLQILAHSIDAGPRIDDCRHLDRARVQRARRQTQSLAFGRETAPRAFEPANLASALDALDQDAITPLEIDLLAHPEQTVTYSVFATPALLRTDDNNGEMSVLYGDLSNESRLLAFLRDMPQPE